jgi:hypothetical protein
MVTLSNQTLSFLPPSNLLLKAAAAPLENVPEAYRD